MTPAASSSGSAEAFIVVGAGLTGLVAAYELIRNGAPVLVLEASERAGGQIAEVDLQGRRLDIGAESIATRGGYAESLLASLGMSADVVTPRSEPAWVFGASRAPYPLPRAAVVGRPVSPFAADVRRALGWSGALRASLDRVLPRAVGSKETSLGGLVKARMGTRVEQRLVNPVVRGVYSTPATDLPLAVASKPLQAALVRHPGLARAAAQVRAASPAGSAVLGVRGGLTRVVEALIAEIERYGGEIRYGEPVISVEATSVTTASETFPGRPLVTATRLVNTPTLTREITVVAAAVRSRALDSFPRGTGVLVSPGAHGVKARALTHSSAKWEWLAPVAGTHLVRLSYDEPPAPADVRRDLIALTGADDLEVIETASRTWIRTIAVDDPAEGSPAVLGEASGLTGLAAIIDQCRVRVGTLHSAAEIEESSRES